MQQPPDVWQDNHISVLGMTRSGKTVWTQKQLQSRKEAVLFFNPQQEKLSRLYTRANKKSDLEAVFSILQDGGKINYIPDLDDEMAAKELHILITQAFQLGQDGSFTSCPLYIVVDEAHFYARQGKRNSDMIKLATRGLRFGIRGVFITQRPALMDKTLYSQSRFHVIFKSGSEGDWYKKYGIDHDQLVKRLDIGGKYSYMIWDSMQLKGAFPPVRI